MMKSSRLSFEPSLWTHNFHFKIFTVPLTNMDTALGISIHLLDQSHNLLLHTKFSQCPPDDLPRPSPGLRKPCRVSYWQLAVLALTVKIRKSQDFPAPISGSPGDQIFSFTFRNWTSIFLNSHLWSKAAIVKLNNTYNHSKFLLEMTKYL